MVNNRKQVKLSLKKNTRKKKCIVFDLEWNQGKGNANEEIPFEIIEIGAVKLDFDRKIYGEYSQIIKPQIYKQMGYAMQKIVPVEMEELRNGKLFVDTIKEYKKWCGKNYIFATWGPLDITQLQVNMEYYKIPLFSKKPLPFLDVQKLFSIEYEDKKTRRTLEYAVDFLKISKDIPFHRAFSDAYYTAKVLEQIKKRDTLEHISYDIFSPAKRKHDEIRIMFSDYYKYISKEFPSKQDALKQKEVKEMRCYQCGRKIKKEINWFFPNMKHGYCVYKCEKHGYVKGKIRLKHSNNGNVYVVKTIRMITENEKDEILEKLKKFREQRRRKPDNNEYKNKNSD